MGEKQPPPSPHWDTSQQEASSAAWPAKAKSHLGLSRNEHVLQAPPWWKLRTRALIPRVLLQLQRPRLQLELFLANELSDEFRSIFVPCSGRRCQVWSPTAVPSGSSWQAERAGARAIQDGSTAAPTAPAEPQQAPGPLPNTQRDSP